MQFVLNTHTNNGKCISLSAVIYFAALRFNCWKNIVKGVKKKHSIVRLHVLYMVLLITPDSTVCHFVLFTRILKAASSADIYTMQLPHMHIPFLLAGEEKEITW